MDGERADLQTADGPLDVYTYRPSSATASATAPGTVSGAGPYPGVILLMDAFGVRPELAGMARRLASHGYVVALPNLYHRTPFAPFDPALVAAGGAERDRFKAMIATLDRDLVMRDVEAVLAQLAADPRVRAGALGVVGYCMGGGYALAAAGTFPERFAAAAIFHAGGLATDRPDSPHTLASAIRARVHVGAAEIDPACPPEQRERLRRALAEAGVTHDIEVHAGARHGFAVTGHAVYDREASERHWSRLLQLFEEALRPAPAGTDRR